MDKKKKEIILFIGSLFVAVMFITGFTSNGSGTPINLNNNTPATKNVSTFLVSGTLNATIVSYGENVRIVEYNASVANVTDQLLSNMENKSMINTYDRINNSFEVYLQNTNAYGIQKNLSKNINNSSFSIISTEYVKLPKTHIFNVSDKRIIVLLDNQDYPITTNDIRKINSTLPLKLNMIVAYENGSYVEYENNIKLTAN